MASEEILKKDGDDADISGHEMMVRNNAGELIIFGDGWQWIITSDSPIKVVCTEEDDDDE